MAGPGRDSFGVEEREQVMDVLASGHLSRYGDLDDPAFTHKVYALEAEAIAHFGAAHAVATSSGTASLLVAFLALGISDGDEVLVPGFTYVASFAAIVFTRAVPVLVEVDESLTLDPHDLRAKITHRTKAILAVHMLGSACDMARILEIASEHDLFVIEDVCQATGGSYRGAKLGSLGTVGAFSFNRYKMLTAGEGGLLVTDDVDVYERSFALHDQGHLPLRATKEVRGPSIFGLNFKMNELTGAVLLAQLRKLDRMLETLRANRDLLLGRLPSIPGVRPRVQHDPDGECATLLTLVFDDALHAASVADELGCRTLDRSGWHAYGQIGQLVHHRTHVDGWSAPARHASPGALPRTDDVLGRCVNISLGITDLGLGAGFGITIHSTEHDIADAAARIVRACHRGTTGRPAWHL